MSFGLVCDNIVIRASLQNVISTYQRYVREREPKVFRNNSPDVKCAISRAGMILGYPDLPEQAVAPWLSNTVFAMPCLSVKYEAFRH